MSDNTLEAKAARGEYQLIEPLDYKIMEALPEEGAMFAELYPLGETVANIAKKLPKAGGKPLPSSLIQTRIRMMKVQGLVINTNSVGGSRGSVWQRTKVGTEVFNRWKESKS